MDDKFEAQVRLLNAVVVQSCFYFFCVEKGGLACACPF